MRTVVGIVLIPLLGGCGGRTSLSSLSDAGGVSIDAARSDDYKIAFTSTDRTTVPPKVLVEVWHSRSQQTTQLEHVGYVSPSFTFDGRFMALRPTAVSADATVLVLDSLEHELWTQTTSLLLDGIGPVPTATIRTGGDRVVVDGEATSTSSGCIATLDENGATAYVPPCDSSNTLIEPSYGPDDTLAAVRIGDLVTLIQRDDGTDQRTVLDFKGDGACFEPAFSFDGTRLVCVRSIVPDGQTCMSHNFCNALWIVDLSTMEHREVTPLDASWWHYPHFTPDGASLIVVKTTPMGHPLERVDIETGAETVLAQTTYLDYSPVPPISVARDGD